MFKSLKAREVMRQAPLELSLQDSAHEVKAAMDEHGSCHLPVTSCGELVGMVCRNDAADASNFRGPGYQSAADIVAKQGPAVPPEAPLSETLFAMFKNQRDCLPVVSQYRELLGVVHAQDIVGVLLSELSQEPAFEEKLAG